MNDSKLNPLNLSKVNIRALQEILLIEADPVRVWQVIALVGWVCVLVLLLRLLA